MRKWEISRNLSLHHAMQEKNCRRVRQATEAAFWFNSNEKKICSRFQSFILSYAHVGNCGNVENWMKCTRALQRLCVIAEVDTFHVSTLSKIEMPHEDVPNRVEIGRSNMEHINISTHYGIQLSSQGKTEKMCSVAVKKYRIFCGTCR